MSLGPMAITRPTTDNLSRTLSVDNAMHTTAVHKWHGLSYANHVTDHFYNQYTSLNTHCVQNWPKLQFRFGFGNGYNTLFHIRFRLQLYGRRLKLAETGVSELWHWMGLHRETNLGLNLQEHKNTPCFRSEQILSFLWITLRNIDQCERKFQKMLCIACNKA